MSDPAVIALTAILGLAVGSFLNVCIYRIPRKESLLHPPSRCPQCGTGLAWFDNIPVVSWIRLRGRCRQCAAPVSLQYPIIELTTAVVAVLVVWLTPPGPLVASRLTLSAILIVLFVIDLQLQILPNVITLPGIVVGVLFSLIGPPGLVASLLGVVLGAGVLYGIASAYYLVRREEGMGMGDMKMLAMIGAFLGWRAVILTLVLASFAGALTGIAVMLTRKEGLRYALPFGTFLGMAAFVAMLAGDGIIDWYLGFYRFP